MSTGLLILPNAQLDPLARPYDRARAKARAQMLVGAALLCGAVVVSAVIAEVRLDTLTLHFDRLTNYFARVFVLEDKRSVFTDIPEWFWGGWKWLRLIGETLIMAYVATVIGAFGAFFLSFLSASNLSDNPLTSFVTRRILEFCRTVPELVFALLFVAAFGLGPLAGMLALSIHTLGALGKQFSEVVENADMKPFEGVLATGGTWSEGVRFALLPQVLSNFASCGLLRFEINVRESAILGFVGAGGIGQELLVAVRRFYYSDVSAIVLMIIATIAIIDVATGMLRHHLIGSEGQP
jgi:phosphonate transport system permease protein